MAKPVLLAGGNPQIAKADGDAPVQAYLDAMPGWKRDVGRRLDAIIVRTVPGVRKAVKWNSPFYGVEGRGWFLSMHTYTRYVKVAFFRGASLRPLPPGESKDEHTRYLDIHEDDLDEAQFARWVKQASKLPGWETNMKKSNPTTSESESASRLIDAKIEELGDWRGKTLAKIRALIHKADPKVVEAVKWRGVPVWEHDGIICTGETYKNAVKLTFFKGASLEDPSGLFNSSLDGNARRAIDIHEGDEIDEAAFRKLIRAAVTLNTSA